MPFQLIKSDLVSIAADAIVYAETPMPFSLFNFNPLLIHKTGKEILKTRDALLPITIGQAKIAPASLLDCKYIIHTSAPAWHGGGYNELRQLRSCYDYVFRLALENDCKSIAIPIIASDKLGYPKKITQEMALERIHEFLLVHPDMTVYLTLPSKIAIMLPGNQFTEVNKYLDKHYAGSKVSKEATTSQIPTESTFSGNEFTPAFSGRIKDLMNRKNISHIDLCDAANLSPAILTDILECRTPAIGKQTVLALGMAFQLSSDEMLEFIGGAGYSLSNDCKFDLVIEYCISKKIYNIWDVNQILFRFEQELLK